MYGLVILVSIAWANGAGLIGVATSCSQCKDTCGVGETYTCDVVQVDGNTLYPCICLGKVICTTVNGKQVCV